MFRRDIILPAELPGGSYSIRMLRDGWFILLRKGTLRSVDEDTRPGRAPCSKTDPKGCHYCLNRHQLPASDPGLDRTTGVSSGGRIVTGTGEQTKIGSGWRRERVTQ